MIPASGLSWGLANVPSQKDEDVSSTKHAADASLFGVFDGHGGKSAAQLCASELCDDLLLASPALAAAEIADAYWRVDAKLGKRGDCAGSTAAVLIVLSEAAGVF